METLSRLINKITNKHLAILTLQNASQKITVCFVYN